jgi:hypothetical protein
MYIYDFLIGLCWVISIHLTLLEVLKRLSKIEKAIKKLKKK